ncbi:GAF and ANTAR domain-containing protein [Streptomyces iconiensis]|uniref:GAF and ANTAR domain-containing protein n=1 Tax=Streptomyces iconiensis TaxID=1384038 RepID=A0ABT6ZRY6_9ACTN|nr:GAF and ANTAR domain-containing protein [Streptomyces iconiensis]MDJ1131815.1 GAF and ANTAR domain-containing protein [Streptomyces iconiensis]
MAREESVLEAMVEAIDTLTEDFDVIDFLHRLSGRCAELLDVTEVGIVIADQYGVLRTIAASSERTRLLELFALQHEQGPCVDCYRSGAARMDIDLTSPEATASFGNFAERAREAGFVTAHALPMRLRNQTVGAMALFHTRASSLAPADARVAQALADVATIAILQQRTLTQTSQEKAQLQHALNSRIAIEQAKGVLAERWNINLDEAFDVLRSYARPRHVRITEVAQQVVAGSLSARDLRA